jgi:aryl-alcohol dehydrogenase-like predicted oxidoreductase
MTTTTLPTRRLGTMDTPALALGCMSMSGMYGSSDRAESIATIHAALDAGVTLLDTGDFYGAGDNELLIAEALSGRARDEVQLSVKFGALRDPDGGFVGHDARPAAVANFLAYTLRRLDTDHIDVYRPARLDPSVPVEDTVGAIAEQVEKGRVRHIGLSEVGADTLRRAHAVHPILDLQIEWSLLTRDVEGPILETCRELGIGVTAYSVLSRGLLSGHWRADRPLAADDVRAHSPRFAPGNLEVNLALVERLGALAATLGITTAQLATAWVLSRGDDVVPVVGARTRDRLLESLAAVDVRLDDDALAAIEGAVPAGGAAGLRYPAPALPALTTT